jgi:hypothetical protein
MPNPDSRLDGSMLISTDNKTHKIKIQVVLTFSIIENCVIQIICRGESGEMRPCKRRGILGGIHQASLPMDTMPYISSRIRMNQPPNRKVVICFDSIGEKITLTR